MNTLKPTFRQRIDNHALPAPGENNMINDSVRCISFRAMLETLSCLINSVDESAPIEAKARTLEVARSYMATWK